MSGTGIGGHRRNRRPRHCLFLARPEDYQKSLHTTQGDPVDAHALRLLVGREAVI